MNEKEIDMIKDITKTLLKSHKIIFDEILKLRKEIKELKNEKYS